MEQSNPGHRIREIRKKAGYTLRELAEECNPPLDYTTVGRIERGFGYTSSTLVRLAEVLNCQVYDFFLPDELVAYTQLSDEMKGEISSIMKVYAQAAVAEKSQ